MNEKDSEMANVTATSSDSWHQVWIDAITKPIPTTFERISSSPNATAKRAYTWLFAVALIIVAVSIALGNSFSGALVSLLYLFLVITINAGVTQSIARMLGGEGTFSKLIYAYSSFSAPLNLILIVLAFLPFSDLLIYPIGIYGIVLNLIAVKGVNKFSWGKAISSSVLVVISVLAIFAILIISLLAPFIGEVFQDIVLNL